MSTRAKKTEGIPKNSCAYLSVLDLMTENSWLKRFKESDHIPQGILEYLQGSNTASARMSIRNIVDWDKEKKGVLNELGQMEDPWVILRVIQEIVSRG